MHVWPAKIVTPSVTYEAVVVQSVLDGDVVIEAQNGTVLATLHGATYEQVGDGWVITYDGGTARVERKSCGCGGSRWYDTPAEAQV